MRIIKGEFTDDQLLDIIAGEMLNIESSTFHFLDGKPREEFSNYDGYPQFKDGPVVNVMRAAHGYVFLPVSMKGQITELINKLADHLMLKQHELIRYDGKPFVHLDNYQYSNGNSARIKIKSSQLGTRVAITGKNSHMRAIIENDLYVSSARFTWIVQSIRKIPLTVTSTNINKVVSTMCNSVFYDRDDVTTYANNDIVFELKNIRGLENMTSVNIKLFDHPNPLLLELSKFNYLILVEIPPDKLRSCPFEQLEVNPIIFNRMHRTDICQSCNMDLYDEIYAMHQHIDRPRNNGVDLYCPICIHRTEGSKIVKNYFNVIRTTYPRTIKDMLSQHVLSLKNGAEFYNAGMETFKGIVEMSVNNYTFYYIGDKYVMFSSTRKYAFAGKFIQDQVAGRKIIFGCYRKPTTAPLSFAGDKHVSLTD